MEHNNIADSTCFQSLVNALSTWQESQESNPTNEQKPPLQYNGKSGRPSFDISKEQLSYFIGLNFTVPDIAKLLGVHKSTVQSRLR